MKLTKLFIGIAIVFAIALLAYSLSDKFEKIEEEIEVGFTGEAGSNSLYISRLFLKKMGIEAEKVVLSHLDKLPSTQAVIIINTHRTTLSKKRIDELLDWVNQGGHLIAIGAPDYLESNSYSDYLQGELGVTIESAYYLDNDRDEDDKEGEDAKEDNKNDEEKNQKSTVSFKLPSLDSTYEVVITRFSPIVSKVESDTLIQLDKRTFLLHRQQKKGAITLLSHLKMVENKLIEQFDHAEFFWQLVHLKQTKPTTVWLLNNDDMPPLWQWLWQYASAFIITFGLFVLFWLYQLSHRLGVLIPPEPLDRRRIIEHIQASGRFFWKYDQKRLVEGSREGVKRKYSTLFPAWNQYSVEEQQACASQHSGLSLDKIKHLLYDNKQYSMDEFVHLVQALEQLRKK